MALSLSWGPDRKPDPETLLKMYDQLDRQVGEIKNQMRRGALGPQQVQAFVEHRADIFPDKFWTIASRGESSKELVADLRGKGWEFMECFSPEHLIHRITTTTDATYYLVGLQAHRFGMVPGDRGRIKFADVVAAAAMRGYQPVPQEAAILLGAMNSRAELGGYMQVIAITDFAKSWGHWVYAENPNVPGGNALMDSTELFLYPVKHMLLVFAVDLSR